MSDEDFGLDELDPVNFKPSKDSIEIVVEEPNKGEDDLFDGSSVGVTNQNDIDKNQDGLDEEQIYSKKKQDKKPSGAEKRIRELVKRNKELKTQNAVLESSAEKAGKDFVNERTRSTKITLSALTNEEKSLERQLSEASETQDTAQIILTTNALQKIKDDMQKLNDYIPTISVPVAKVPEVKSKELSFEDQYAKLPEEGQNWITNNPEFMSNSDYRVKAISHGRILELEGYDPDSTEYWEELSNKMDSAPSKRKQRKKAAPVTNSSRVTRTSKRTTVRLSADERDMAERMGITPKAYAERVLEIEDSPGSYTQIKIGS